MTEIQTTAELAEAAAMPRSHALIVDDDARPCVENAPLPKQVAERPIEQKSPAEWAYERLILYIENFEEQLDAEHEVAMGLVGSDVGALHIQGIGYFAPDILTFYGTSDAGGKMQLVQHVSQLNVMLVAAPKIAEKPTRLGFRLKQSLENSAD